MKVRFFEQEEGLTEQREVWLQVFSNEAVDLVDVLNALPDEQRHIMASYDSVPSRYYPHLVTPPEKAEHGYSREEWWVFLEPATVRQLRADLDARMEGPLR